jgi:hypothetical protein
MWKSNLPPTSQGRDDIRERRIVVTQLVTTRELWFLFHMGSGVACVYARAGGMAGLAGSRTTGLLAAPG